MEYKEQQIEALQEQLETVKNFALSLKPGIQEDPKKRPPQKPVCRLKKSEEVQKEELKESIEEDIVSSSTELHPGRAAEAAQNSIQAQIPKLRTPPMQTQKSEAPKLLKPKVPHQPKVPPPAELINKQSKAQCTTSKARGFSPPWFRKREP